MTSLEEVAKAKHNFAYKSLAKHGSEYAVVACYEWLDAQRKTKRIVSRTRALRGMIESWSGLYVAEGDFEIAAFLHPEIKTSFPRVNVSMKLTLPSDSRLSGVVGARQREQRKTLDEQSYSFSE